MLLVDAFCPGRYDERAGFKDVGVECLLVNGHVVKALVVALKLVEGGAFRESFVFYYLYAVWNVDGNQVFTATESVSPYACHAVGDVDGCQSVTANEDKFIYSHHVVGYDGFHAAGYQNVCFGVDNGVAVVS